MTSPSRGQRISDTARYKWKVKFGGFDVSDARRPKALQDARQAGGPMQVVITLSPRDYDAVLFDLD